MPTRMRSRPLPAGVVIIPGNRLLWCETALLGSGSSGKVYKGMLHSEEVAIKFLESRPDLSHGTLWRGLLHEVQMLMGHSHGNVISFKGVCLLGVSPRACPCIVMEYCPNGTLYEFMRKSDYRSKPWPEKLQLALGVAKGMLFLHSQEKPIIHHDLRSPNIVLKRDFTPVVTDLGMASHGPARSNTDQNPMWLAPEIACRNEDATTKSDVYSFSIIMWEILTGAIPWDGLVYGAIFCLGHQERLPLPGCSSEEADLGVGEYIELMQQCWEEDPSHRPGFEEIVDRLEGIASGLWEEYGRRDQFVPLCQGEASLSLPHEPGSVATGCFMCPSFPHMRSAGNYELDKKVIFVQEPDNFFPP